MIFYVIVEVWRTLHLAITSWAGSGNLYSLELTLLGTGSQTQTTKISPGQESPALFRHIKLIAGHVAVTLQIRNINNKNLTWTRIPSPLPSHQTDSWPRSSHTADQNTNNKNLTWTRIPSPPLLHQTDSWPHSSHTVGCAGQGSSRWSVVERQGSSGTSSQQLVKQNNTTETD